MKSKNLKKNYHKIEHNNKKKFLLYQQISIAKIILPSFLLELLLKKIMAIKIVQKCIDKFLYVITTFCENPTNTNPLTVKLSPRRCIVSGAQEKNPLN